MRKNVPLNPGKFQLAKRVALGVCLFFNLFLAANQSFGQSQLLKDVNTIHEMIYDEYTQLKPATGILYFTSVGKELWKTTGTSGGTVRIKTFGRISNLTTIGNTAYFIADDGKSGPELWKSSGTLSSTALVKDITPGPTGTELESLFAVGSTLYFVARDGFGKELWKSNGTAAGTVMVKDIFPKGGSSNPGEFASMGGKLYFTANDGTHGYELWKSDGTATGTTLVADIITDVRVSSQPKQVTAAGSFVYFSANYPGTGRELWKSDGTAAGTVLVKDIFAGANSSGMENLTDVNGTLFFTASDGISGQELWKSNGTATGTVLVKDMTPGSAGSHGTGYFAQRMGNFTNANGILFYTAYENGTLKIWRSNGTAAGTLSLQVLGTQGFSYIQPTFTVMNGVTYYFNISPTDGNYTLWRINSGSTTPIAVKAFELPADEFGYELRQVTTAFNGNLYFSGLVDNDYKLFKSNGTAAGTTILKDAKLITLPSEPYFFATINNKTIFTAQVTIEDLNAASATQLWSTDGTPAGTIKLAQANGITTIAATDNLVFFSEYTSTFNIWKSDGTVGGTVLIEDDIFGGTLQEGIAVNNRIYAKTYQGQLYTSDGTAGGTYLLSSHYAIDMLYDAGDLLLYVTHQYGGEVELWRSNGTVAGTYKVKTLAPDTWRWNWAKQNNAYLNGVLYFIANDLVHGAEVWRSDGTAAGTYMFADLNSSDDNGMGAYDFDIASLGVYDDNLYISALDNTDLWALFKSDGIQAPSKVLDLYPVSNIIDGGDKLYLFATYSHTYPQAITNTVHLWVSDGTAAGTMQLSDERNSQNIDYEIVDDVLYYAGQYTKMFRSDGTVCGTFEVNTGVTGAHPMESVNSKIIFKGYGAGVGYEPFAYNTLTAPGSPCAETLAVNAVTESEQKSSDEIKVWPNPFTQDFSVESFDGTQPDEVQVFTATGFPVETIDLRSNAKLKIGQNWQPGMYILRINIGGKITTQMIVKK